MILIITHDTCADNIRLHESVLLIEKRGGEKFDDIVIIVTDDR